ncbi:RNA polymerase sigma factor [Flavobacterium aquicola]|uniref:RNA polymerase sigma factor (Sigma-70 family) n=1 Tax=Flavobacterium aquicola TaxID=1682742 RepID=A0A3E0EDM9_9FLAO|nr:RNA polymerase sigma factor [Flavobacterium aquicola]REG96388.1 RNA polymerase sigma factor (sigma-70 family) [Flavobacterium aquicola]
MSNKPQQDVGKLVTAYKPRLDAFIRKRVSNKEDAEDILQDVFYQLAKVDTAMNPIEQVTAWLYRVARNMIINKQIKKHEEELPSYLNDDDEMLKDISEMLFSKQTSPSPETEYLRSLMWVELENALSELPLEQREVFEKTELDGLSFKEISEETGVSVNTLLSRKRYAVLHLRKRLSELYEEIIYS